MVAREMSLEEFLIKLSTVDAGGAIDLASDFQTGALSIDGLSIDGLSIDGLSLSSVDEGTDGEEYW